MKKPNPASRRKAALIIIIILVILAVASNRFIIQPLRRLTDTVEYPAVHLG